MYLADATNSGSGYEPRRYGSIRKPPAPPTSVALDDRFDQMTTEVPTEWNVGGRRGRDYDESISGYRNYVREVENMLESQVEVEEEQIRQGGASMITRRFHRASPEIARSPLVGGGRRSLSGFASMDNIRQVSGRKASVDLVEHRILEDGPHKSISIWRERVARSNAEENARYTDDMRSETNSHAHRRVPSASSQPRRGYVPEYTRQRAESIACGMSPRKGKEVLRNYERSEYMVLYQKPTKNGAIPLHLHPPSEIASPNMGSKRSMPPPSPKASGPKSPTIRRSSGRSQQLRDEYVVTYPNTPPHSQGSIPSSNSPRGLIRAQNNNSASPRPSRTYVPIDNFDEASVTKSTSTSSVELILADCEPSLLHIAPALSALGINRLEHLRAINRLSDETRDKEVKEEALRQGVTVMEWAILLDKLQTL